MNSLMDITLKSNKKIKVNFNGGELSSDGGLLVIKEFVSKLEIDKLIRRIFKTNDKAEKRGHKDDENLFQMIYQIIASYFTDNNADELKNEPVFTTILDKESLASQPTLSRFHSRMDNDTLDQFNDIAVELRRTAYSIKMPEMVLFDVDTSLLETYGKQEGEGYNFHYGAHGYHPQFCYDGLTGDLLKGELRKGTDHCSKGITQFMQPLLDEYQNDYPDVEMFLRGDSGYATPELFIQCETNGVSYVVKLKNYKTLLRLALEFIDELNDKSKDNIVDYAVVYGELEYQANSWEYPRRVICKVEKPYGQMFPMISFFVTNMDLSPEKIVWFYRNRGRMENFIKEGKNGFDFGAVSSRYELVNSNRFQVHVLAYNIFNLFRRLALPESMSNNLIDTIRMKLIKIAAKIVRSGRYIFFKLCSSCPYKDIFFKTLENIWGLQPQLE
jgi:hypothetical protein